LTKDLDQELKGRWEEYLRLFRAGAIYPAFVRLAEIANCVQHCGTTRDSVSKWTSVVRDVVITPNEMHAIRAAAEKNSARVKRILDGAEKINYEEFVLIITLLTELDLLRHYLVERGVTDFSSAVPLYEEMIAAASSPNNRSAHRSAQAAARQNWGIPVSSRWLGTVTIE
jgi:hypothetical protein